MKKFINIKNKFNLQTIIRVDDIDDISETNYNDDFFCVSINIKNGKFIDILETEDKEEANKMMDMLLLDLNED